MIYQADTFLILVIVLAYCMAHSFYYRYSTCGTQRYLIRLYYRGGEYGMGLYGKTTLYYLVINTATSWCAGSDSAEFNPFCHLQKLFSVLSAWCVISKPSFFCYGHRRFTIVIGNCVILWRSLNGILIIQ